MNREILASKFSERLNARLCEQGYQSQRSVAGVQFKALAKAAGVSIQMARKYALGIALPEPEVTLKIAHWLGVSPGWLIFGEAMPDNPESAGEVMIKQELLAYILNRCFENFGLSQTAGNVVEYMLEVIYDASHLNTDIPTTKHIIDMMLSSTMVLNKSYVKKTA